MKLLFICTHNRCRSILAEAITHHLAGSQIVAASAGSNPAGVVHPLSIKYLDERGINTGGLMSQSWNDFADFDPNAVITLCDSALNEACPVWFGSAIKVHWGLADPSKVNGNEEQQRAAFNQTIRIIEQRIKRVLALKLVEPSPEKLQTTLDEIARSVT